MIDAKATRILAKMRKDVLTGTPLADAIADFRDMFTDPRDLQAVDSAGEELARQLESVEHLRKPVSLRAEGRNAWYPGPQPGDVFWPALTRYLSEEKGRDDDTIAGLDEASTKVVSLLDSPFTPGFSTRGLVVGYVQSGKTSNFTAVISKAADVGFRIFIVLSGLTNALRQQTQQRLDSDLASLNQNQWLTWTNDLSDIGEIPFNINALVDTNKRHLAVVKKNGPRLRRLLRLLQNINQTLKDKCPVLIIDDECDQASLNASGKQDRLTKINELLRDCLAELPKVSYLGYTATPYANVLIDPGYPSDLYPRDFIVSLEKPSAYFGAEELFGRDLLDADPEVPDDEGLDMIRLVPEQEIEDLCPPSRDDKDTFTIEITPSLRRAILYYVMATAARDIRGQSHDHSCMLVHTTLYSSVHVRSAEQIKLFCSKLRQMLDHNDPGLLGELEQLWAEESEKLPAGDFGHEQISFAELRDKLGEVLTSVEVIVENSISDQRIDFSQPSRRYIVVGGNVLARGLTIEGLVVSFFVRRSNQYDSLTQMGRWFGYRPGYEDLPRIWMTSELSRFFRDMATVEAEIRHDIDVYERENLSPLEFAIRVRTHPDLAITARNKMTAAIECDVSFSGKHPQTRMFPHRDLEWLTSNWNAGITLLNKAAALTAGREEGSRTVFAGVPFTVVIDFLRNYRIHPQQQSMAAEAMIEYIARQNSIDSSLTKWDLVVVQGTGQGSSQRELGPLGRVATVVRSRLKKTSGDELADIKALMSKSDAVANLDSSLKKENWDTIVRNIKIPLLILYPIDRVSGPPSSKDRESLGAATDVLGVALVFPQNDRNAPVKYVRAAIQTELFEEPEYEEEEEIA